MGLIQAESLGELQLSLGKTNPSRDCIEFLICDSSSGKDGGGGGCSDSSPEPSETSKSSSSSGLWTLFGKASSVERGRRNGPESSRRY